MAIRKVVVFGIGGFTEEIKGKGNDEHFAHAEDGNYWVKTDAYSVVRMCSIERDYGRTTIHVRGWPGMSAKDFQDLYPNAIWSRRLEPPVLK